MRLLLILTYSLVSVYSWAQHQDLFPYQKGELWGYADSSGQMVLEPIYRVAGRIENAQAVVVLSNSPEYLLIDRRGNYLSSVAVNTLRSYAFDEGLIANHYSNFYFRDSLLFSKDVELKVFLLQYALLYRSFRSSSMYLLLPNGKGVRAPSGSYNLYIYPKHITLSKNPATGRWSYLVVQRRYPSYLYFFDQGVWVLTELNLNYTQSFGDTLIANHNGRNQEVTYSAYPFRELNIQEPSLKIDAYRVSNKNWRLANTETKKRLELKRIDTVHAYAGNAVLAERWRRKDSLYYFIDDWCNRSKLPYRHSVKHLGYGLFRLEPQNKASLVNLQRDTLLKNRSFGLEYTESWHALASTDGTYYTLLYRAGRWLVTDSASTKPRLKVLGRNTLWDDDCNEGRTLLYQRTKEGVITVSQLKCVDAVKVLHTANGTFYSTITQDPNRQDTLELLDSNFKTVFSYHSKRLSTHIDTAGSGVFKFKKEQVFYYFNKEGIRFWSNR